MELEAQVVAQRAAQSEAEAAILAARVEAEEISTLRQIVEDAQAAVAAAEANRKDPELEAKAKDLEEQLNRARHEQESTMEERDTALQNLRTMSALMEECKQKCSHLDAQLSSASAAAALATHDLKEAELEHENSLAIARGDLARAEAELKQLEKDLELVCVF